MLTKFFDYLPRGDFHYFNLAHILSVVLGILVIIGICFILRKTNHKYIRKILIGVEIIVLSLEFSYWGWEIANIGKIDIQGSLPLYYCSLFYMVLPFCIWPKNEKVKQGALSYIASFNMIAGLMGLVFNTNFNYYPVFSFVGVRSLLYHFLMLFVGLLVWVSKYYKPNIHHSYEFITPLLIVFTPALIVDIKFDADYFYLNDGRFTPFNILAKAMPQTVYIIVLYLGILALTNLIFFSPTIIKHIKSKKNKASN